MILRESDLPELARKLRPYLLPDMRAIGTSGGRNTSTGGVATMATHELASTSALGAYHTVSGLTAGQVLKATASNAASFGALNHNQLGGIGANDHHSQQHSITGSDHTLTASQYQVVGATATNTLGLLTPSADVSGGGTSLLRSNAGALALATLTAGTKVTAPLLDTASGDLSLSPASGITTLASLHASTRVRTPLLDTASGNMTIAPAGDLILDPVGNDVLPNLNYDINLGMLSKKYLTLHAAELWVETLVAQDTIATIGGRILVGPTTTLTSDLPSGDTTIYVKHNQMTSGDRVYMEAGGNFEFFAVTSGPSGSGPYSYTVTRNLDGSGANTWHAGDAIFNTGKTGDGFIDLYSLRGVRSATEYGPAIVGNLRKSATYNDWAARWALGNLNGNYGYSATTMGLAAGDYTAAWVAAEATNGFRIMSGSTARLQADMSGNLRLFNAAGTSTIALDSDGTSYFAGPMTLGTSGGIYQGTGTFASPTTGLKIWRDSGIGRIGGYNGGTLQWYGSTDGRLYAGHGKLWIDTSGITIRAESDFANDVAYRFIDSSGSNLVGGLFALEDIAKETVVSLRSKQFGTRRARIEITAEGSSTYPGSARVAAFGTNDVIVSLNSVSAAVSPFYVLVGETERLSVLTTGVTVTGTLTAQTINHASGPNLQYGGSTKLAIVSTGATVTGVLTTSGDMVIGSSDSSPSLTIGQAAALSTGDASIELGYGRTGSGYSYIDLIGDTTYSDYGLRIIRSNAGANAGSSITHRGTGDFNLQTTEAAAIKLRTNNTLRATVQSTGELLAEYGAYVNGDQGGISGYLGLTDVTTGVSTGTGTVRMNSTSSGVASAGWLKAYIGTTTIYIPYWTSMS